jgi:heme-degrading monooxygenase HmoA
MQDRFCTIWAFEVPQEAETAFCRHYGADGSWVQLFRQAPGYIETLLLRDRAQRGRFLTIDRWQSESAYDAFRKNFAVQYAELDRRCAELSRAEVALGTFVDCH